MRYINLQPHATTCGPIAVMNLLKDLGMKISYKKYIELFYTLGCGKRDMGTSPHDLANMLKLFGIKYKYSIKNNVRDVERKLKSGKVLIMSYRWYENGKSSGHFIFVDKQTKNYINGYNLRLNKVVTKISKKTLRRYRKRSGNSKYFTIFEINI